MGLGGEATTTSGISPTLSTYAPKACKFIRQNKSRWKQRHSSLSPYRVSAREPVKKEGVEDGFRPTEWYEGGGGERASKLMFM